MAVKIRLKRMGTTKQHHWRLVVADGRYPRDGRFIEQVGHYHPKSDPAGLVVDTERVDYWVSKGAQMSTSVKNLVKKAKSKK